MASRLIDADALVREINESGTDGTIANYVRGVLAATLDHAPTVDAEPVRHGRWVKMTGMMPPEYHGHYECSECQWSMKGPRNSWAREEELTYCPNCGAKMDGGSDG